LFFNKKTRIEGTEFSKKSAREVNMRKVGGEAPADCSFDLADKEFRCGYTFGDKGTMYFLDPPELVYDKLYLGQSMSTLT